MRMPAIPPVPVHQRLRAACFVFLLSTGCPAALPSERSAEVQDPRITEASGIIASRRHPGFYYVHNDSGDTPRVFLLGADGATRLLINLQGAQAIDWEDIAIAPPGCCGVNLPPATSTGGNGPGTASTTGDGFHPPPSGDTSQPASTPSTWYVCVGDIGDNNATRSSIFVYCFAEPALPVGSPADKQGRDREGANLPNLSATPKIEPPSPEHTTPPSDPKSSTSPANEPPVITVAATAFELRYPDRPHDAEAIVIHPETGTLYVLTKALDGASDAYKLPPPWRSDAPNTLIHVGPLNQAAAGALTAVTAADISPDGTRLITRSYLTGWERTLAASSSPAAEQSRDRKGANASALPAASSTESTFDQIFSRQPCRIDLPPEPQGEAVCYTLSGVSVLTISEHRPTFLHETPVR